MGMAVGVGVEINYGLLLLSSMRTKSLTQTQQIHAQILTNSIFSNTHLANLTAESYFKCKSPHIASRVLDQMPHRDSFSWSPAIAFYSQNKQSEKVLEIFQLMNRQGYDPNRSSLVSTLKSCADLTKLRLGKQLHSQILKKISPSTDVIVGNVLINFYSKCGLLSEAVRLFNDIIDKDLVSWTSMLSGYSHNGLTKEVWEFFASMIHKQGLGFSHHAFSIAAKACSELEDGKPAGEQLHCLVLKVGFESHLFVASALLDMYSKHGMLACSRKIFDSMVEPNVVSWTSIITGYAQINGVEALKLFRSQICVGVTPDPYSLSSILSACANIPALEFGKQVHACVIKSGFENQIFSGNSLIGMYSRCGCLSDAHKTLDSMSKWDVISWTAMIACYAQHGCGANALEMFKRMREQNIKPNAITFVAVLSACSRSGLVEEGILYFQSMETTYGIEAGEEHYTCMVDLLARNGRVKEAEELIEKMPFKPSASAWGALLNGCRAVGELGLGLKCAQELFRLEPKSASNHVLLANMYAANGRWEDMRKTRSMMREKGLKKESGYSWIEICKNVSIFGVGDNLHPQSDQISSMLHQLSLVMEEIL